VFECRFSAADLARCKHALGRLIHHHEDQVLFVNPGPADGRGDRVITSIGRAYAIIDTPCIIVDGEDDGPITGTKRKVDALKSARARRALSREDEIE
jgi:hypothetical protein